MTLLDETLPSSAAQSAAPEIGDFAPNLKFRDGRGTVLGLYDDQVVGRPVLLLLHEAAQREALRAAFLDSGLDPRAVTIVAVPTDKADGTLPGWPAVAVSGPEVAQAYGAAAGEASTAILLDPHCRLAGRWSGSAATLVAAATVAIATMLSERQPLLMQPHPPVLCIPNVLSGEDCARLIEIWGRDVEWRTGADFLEAKGDFKTQVNDYGRVDRVEYVIRDPEISRWLDDRMARRVVPQIYKAFQYRVTRRELFHVSCYEGARGGFQHGHRDNPAPELAYRRFALSLNLNTSEYEGGALRFPEYGEQRYRLAAGSALVFSSSLLHEVLEVTAGRRFVLLTHFYGEDGVRKRRPAEPRSGG